MGFFFVVGRIPYKKETKAANRKTCCGKRLSCGFSMEKDSFFHKKTLRFTGFKDHIFRVLLLSPCFGVSCRAAGGTDGEHGGKVAKRQGTGLQITAGKYPRGRSIQPAQVRKKPWRKCKGVRASSSLAGRGFPAEKGMEKGVKLPYDFGK